MATYDVPEAAAGVCVPGEGSWTTAAGFAEIEGTVPVTTDMRWPIRSVTKPYTVGLILQLADEGKPSLDDALDTYVDGVTDGDQITLLELANMSSGNADYVNEAFIAQWQAEPAKIFTLDELNSGALGQPAQLAAGTKYMIDASKWVEPHSVGYVIEDGVPQAQTENSSILGPAGAIFSTLEDGRAGAVTLGSGALLNPETQKLSKM